MPTRMQSEDLSRLVVASLGDLKAIDVVVLDVRELTDVSDYMIVASGRSRRHVSAIAENISTGPTMITTR